MAPSMDWNNMNPKIECVCAEIKRGSGTIFNIVFWQTIISPWTNERLNLNQLWRWGDGLRISFPWHCYSKGQCTLDLITLAFWALTLFRYSCRLWLFVLFLLPHQFFNHLFTEAKKWEQNHMRYVKQQNTWKTKKCLKLKTRQPFVSTQ